MATTSQSGSAHAHAFTRRRFVHLSVVGLSATAVSSLLAACQAPAAAPTSAPAAAPTAAKPAATTAAPAAAATTAAKPAAPTTAPAAPTTAPAAAQQAAGNGVTLKILVPQGALADGLTKTAPAYTQETGNKVEVDAFPYSDLQQKVFTQTQTKSDEYDMFFADDPWVPNIRPNVNAVAIDKDYGYKRDDDIFPVCYDVFTWPPPYGPAPQAVRAQNLEPHLYGLPIVGNVILYTIRKDVLDDSKLSVPATWDDALNVAKTVHDPNKPFYGFITRGSDPSTDSIPMLWSLGGDIFDDNFNVVFDNEAGVAMARTLSQLIKYAPPGVTTYDTNEFGSDFVAGRAMMGMSWPGDTLVSMEDPAKSKSAGKLLYMNSPAGKPGGKGGSMLGNWGLIPNAAGKKRDQSFNFMSWITSKEHSLEFAKNGGVPFRKSNLNDASLVKQFPWYPAQADALAAPAHWRPRTVGGPAILQQFIGPNMNLMLGGQLSPEDTVKKAANEIRDYMKTVTD